MQNLPKRVEPGAPTPIMTNQKVCDLCAELELLVHALFANGVAEASGHAELALQVLDGPRRD